MVSLKAGERDLQDHNSERKVSLLRLPSDRLGSSHMANTGRFEC